MSDCTNADMRDLLPDLLHGSLDEPTRLAAEAHVAGCADCRAELALLRSAQAAIRRTPAPDVARIVRALPRPPATTRELESLRSPGRVPASRAAVQWRRAAVIAAIVVGGTAVAVGTRDRSQTRRGSTAGQRAPSPAAPRATAGYAVAGGAGLALAPGLQDLDEAELDTLLREIEALDAMPSEDPAPVLPALLVDVTEGGA